MEDRNDSILTPQEIEAYIEHLEPFQVPEIGSPSWHNQRERLYQLSVQAALDVKCNREEIIKEHLITFEKIVPLIQELIATEVWRLNIFPCFLEMASMIKSSIPIYIVLYHEATLCSLIEAVLFHEQVVESAADGLVDLVDYCYRNVIPLTNEDRDAQSSSDINLNEIERLKEQNKEIRFECSIKCISLLSSMAQHLKILPLSVLHRLLVIHDIPLLLTKLLDHPPWERTGKDGKEVYQDGRWNTIRPNETLKISKVEGQVWISLIQLLLNPECQKKYDISGYKKDQLLKLRSRLNEVLFDQIPILRELMRYLEHLSLFDAPLPKTGIVIEQEAEIWVFLQKEYKTKWNYIAKGKLRDYFSPSENELKLLCQKLTRSFDQKNLEAMLPDHPVCANCGKKGKKKCSRCKNEYYCGRKCQVSHWSVHQPSCDHTVE